MKSLAVEYRPTSFDDLTEQESIKKILSYQIQTNTIQNAYLFTGPAGCGKTTSARIFAGEINQHKGLPIELDAASNNSVDDIRDICKQAQSKSLDSEYKVFIIDECHVLSNQAWQAMLKTLEEPPMKSIFILCTTNPEKIPATILSRVQRYNFQRISTEGIVRRLEVILNAEQNRENEFYNISPDALSYIANLAEGGMRDAISLLDKCLSYSKELSVHNIVQALGVADYDTMFTLTAQIINKEEDRVIQTLNTIHANGVDITQFFWQYFEFLQDIHKYRVLHSFEYSKIPPLYQSKVEAFLDYPKLLYDLLKLIMNLCVELGRIRCAKEFALATILLFMKEA